MTTVRHQWLLVTTTPSAVAVLLAVVAGCETGSAAVSDDTAVVDGSADAALQPEATADAPLPCEPEVVADASVPAPYAGLQSPFAPTAGVIASGKIRFGQRCGLCHGPSGRGDGLEGPFAPPAADLTSTLRSQDYLFWRISEGGSLEPFCTAMPAFRKLYTEQARWELVAYIRELAGARDASVDAADAAGD